MELEDTQSQLQQDLRSRMAIDGNTHDTQTHMTHKHTCTAIRPHTIRCRYLPTYLPSNHFKAHMSSGQNKVVHYRMQLELQSVWLCERQDLREGWQDSHLEVYRCSTMMAQKIFILLSLFHVVWRLSLYTASFFLIPSILLSCRQFSDQVYLRGVLLSGSYKSEIILLPWPTSLGPDDEMKNAAYC